MFQHFNMIAIIIIIIIIIIVVVVVVPDIVSRHRSWLLSCDDSLQRCRDCGDDDWYRATHKCRAAPVVVSTAQDPCLTGEAGDRPTAVGTGKSISE